MRKLTVLSVTIAAMLTAALWGAPAFAQEEQPAGQEATTTDAPADASSDASSDAAPSDAAPAGEDKPAEQ